MSWSISLLGKPENVCKALEEESGKLTGQSKVEYDSALPHIVALVKNNFVPEDRQPPMIKLSASGHGTCRDPGGPNEKQIERNVSVSIAQEYCKIV